MLEETGTVVDVQQDRMWVETTARSSCSACGTTSCSTAVISRLFGMRRNLLEMNHELDAKTGDRVVVGIPDHLLVRASVWAYLAPLAIMVAATLIANLSGADDGFQAFSAAVGLIMGFGLVRYLVDKTARQKQFEPQLVRVIGAHAISKDFNGIRVM